MTTTQDWLPGKMVKVGFLTFRVVQRNPRGYWELASRDGTRMYEFRPYCGLNRIPS